MKLSNDRIDINEKKLLVHGTYLPSAKFIYDYGLISLNHFEGGEYFKKSHRLDKCPCCQEIPKRIHEKYTLRGDSFFSIMGNPIKGQSNSAPPTSFYGIGDKNIDYSKKNVPWGFPGFHFGVLYDPRTRLDRFQEQFSEEIEFAAFKGEKEALKILALIDYYKNIVNEVAWYAKGRGRFRYEYRYGSCIPYKDISAFVVPGTNCGFTQSFSSRFFMKSFDYKKKITSQKVFEILANMMEKGDAKKKKPIYDTNNNLLYPI